MTLKDFILASVAAIGAFGYASGNPARADGVPATTSYKDTIVAPIQTWQGFYLGAHIGGAWTNVDSGRTTYFETPAVAYAPTTLTNINRGLNGDAVFGGLTVGYNWQRDNCCFVYGLELDIGGFRDNESKSIDVRPLVAPFENTRFFFSDHGGFYGDITGRLGYSWSDSLLLYAKGGFAWLNNSFHVGAVLTSPTGVVTSVSSTTGRENVLTGWTAGGGIEYKYDQNWSVKLEYLHFDFGQPNAGDCCFLDANHIAVFKNIGDLTADSVKFGINYYVYTPPAPLK
jgi:opacity protein-like surface antigen